MAQSNGLPNHIGREVEEEIGGQVWRFARWDRGVWHAFASWARTVLPDPVAALTARIDEVVKKDLELLAWLKRRDDDEAAAAEKEKRAPVLLMTQFRGLADELAARALDKAASYLSFLSPEIQSLLNDPYGESYIVYLLLKKHHPSIDPDQAYDLTRQVSRERLEGIFKTVSGEQPKAPKNSAAPAASP